MMLPQTYAWLAKEKAPRILVEALKLYGTKEIKGVASNQQIIAWAKELGGIVGAWYADDDKPWCGLFLAICAKRAGLDYPVGFNSLRAKEWSKWGKPSPSPMLGDVLVFNRAGGGHVGLYVGEDLATYHVLGGNQGDSVSICRIEKSRLLSARRTDWKVSQPENIRKVTLSSSGTISHNES